MAASTCCLYLLLSFGRLLTVHKITSKEVSKWQIMSQINKIDEVLVERRRT